MKIRDESGIALISTLLILVLLGALLTGFIVSVNSDQGLIAIDRDQNRAYYAAQAGLEKLTADLGTLFDSNYAPTTAEINALAAAPPVLTGISFTSPDGGSGYQITYPVDGAGRPVSVTRTIPSGPYEGLVGIITQYTMTVTARTTTGSEVRMRRALQTVAVPVFQFGIFSETDLSFHAGPDFAFGGRVHTNGNLFLAEGDNNDLDLTSRVTALGEVVRTNLINGHVVTDTYNGRVNVITSPGVTRPLEQNEGSIEGAFPSDPNDPTWTNLSIGTYNGNIRNGRTGARRMDLPLVDNNATPVDLIRRPLVNENTANPDLFRQRYFAMASLRILLSDTAAEITSLPTVTAGAPVQLVNPFLGGLQTIGESTGAAPFTSQAGTPLVDGFIKIEMQDQAGNWQDVTNEILGYGVSGRSLNGARCLTDPADSIIRLQRYRDSVPVNCNPATDKYWPNTLYDTREGAFRDSHPAGVVYVGGVMHYIELDVANLCRWLQGTLGPGTGATAMNTTGYVLYFSDRRTNRNGANQETGEYGFEDFVNPDRADGSSNGNPDEGEDVNGDAVFDTYGGVPRLPAGTNTSPLDGTARPSTQVAPDVGRRNKAIFFRRALKLVNGSVIDLGNNSDGRPYGLAVATENPLYVQGDYNFNGGFGNPHAPCSLIADAVTFLSSSWNDRNSFSSPQSPAGRVASNTSYRAAIIAGKGRPFPEPAVGVVRRDFGTDGGVHNFFRLLENWGGRQLNFRGAMVSLFFNRQAVGTYKYDIVYGAPGRGYNFDTEFLDPNLLPPRTPMFRDVNITGFTRLTQPNQ